MELADPVLVDHLRLAYSAEKAAAFAYIGHAASLRDPGERAYVRRIEREEWEHRDHVGRIMRHYGIPVSRWYECKYHVIGKVIGWSCHLIGRFMPFFFAGRLESGNVCEYVLMVQRFHRLGITEHDAILIAMGLTEKEHEDYFAGKVADSRWLPFFERLFAWGPQHSGNDVPSAAVQEGGDPEAWCRHRRDAPLP